MIGKTILHYKILEKLGEGGMGVVYKAEDTKLERVVALKFLPTNRLTGEEEKKRFKREAKAAAALNHPNICHIYAIDEADEQLFIAMEFIEGKSLAEMVGANGGSPLQITDAINYATQIAAGLQAAHEKGITHRDIKSANVMVTDKGVVKIMDFGLAKLGDRSMMTKEGTTLGTAAYMSPEQARGEIVDQRSDIWSLGVVLYEMISGRLPFRGEYEQAMVYSILNEEPEPLTALRSNVPIALDGIIAKALAKDPATRYQHVDELPADLKMLDTASLVKSRMTNMQKFGMSAANSTSRLKRLIPAAFILTVIIAIAFAYLYFTKPTITETGIIQFSILPPEGTTFTQATPIISPDGKTLVYTAVDSAGKSLIWMRPLSSIKAIPLAGTEYAASPFWSYDSRFIGFFANGKLNKLNISTGSIQILCDAGEGYGGTWCSTDLIVFTPSFFSPAFKINANGGVATEVTKLDISRAEENHHWAQLLPDNQHFIYSAFSRNEGNSGYYVGSVNDNSQVKIMNTKRSIWSEKARFISPDHLFFLKDNALMLQKFDPANYKLHDEPQLVLTNVSDFSISDNVLVTSQNAVNARSELILYDREGRQIEQMSNLGLLIELSVSPDENSVAYHLIIGNKKKQTFNQDIWILNRKRQISSRFTTEPAADISPIWSPDGNTIVYASSPDSVYDIYKKDISDNSKLSLLVKTNLSKIPIDWSSDGKYILYETQGDLWILPMFGDEQPFPYFRSNFLEKDGSFSPDAKWIAHRSNESGKYEVYLQSFPEPKQKYQVSTNGGRILKWSQDGGELFYASPENNLMVVDIKTFPHVTIGAPSALFKVKADIGVYPNTYAVLDNGKHLLVNQISKDNPSKPLQVIVNWRASLGEK